MPFRDVLIGLGANLGRPQLAIREAIERLDVCAEQMLGELTQTSGMLQTQPVASGRQADYWNAAVRLRLPAELEPRQLLTQLQAIEQAMGRERKQRWGPRVIDLDLLLDECGIFFEPQLQVPHPWLSVRRFALAPCAELAPDWPHPILARPLSQLLADHERKHIGVLTKKRLLDHEDDPFGAELFHEASEMADAAKDPSLHWGDLAHVPQGARRAICRFGDLEQTAALVVIGDLADLYRRPGCLLRLSQLGKPFVACEAKASALAETVSFVDAAMRC